MLIIMGEHYRTIVDLRSSQMLKVPASPPLAGKLQQQYIVKKQQREILTLAGSERREYSTVTIPTLKFGKEPCYHVKTYIEDKADDYTAIMIKAIGDRFAEACAEYLHKKVRDAWQYGQNEPFKFGDSIASEPTTLHPHAAWLIKENYRGIRPAAGYPASPDHTEKATLWQQLDAEVHTDIALTENFAMNPPSSVSGLYFSHPESRYFNVGQISIEQLEDYAQRKSINIKTAEKWLKPNL